MMTRIRNIQKPNFLVILVDEQRYPPVYENRDLKEWRAHNLVTQELLRTNGLEFNRHYIGSAACCPSRATLFTGHYPSLHGVSQTNGIAKEASDPDMFWLNRNTVPTMGHYFREAGYQTYYKGKWHVSYEDIIIPGTHNGLLSYDPITGIPNKQKEDLYLHVDPLDDFGLSSWIGPEPHGKNPRNSASSAGIGVSGRDEFYAAEVVELIESLDHKKRNDGHLEPWLLVASFVNPHDIVLYGALTDHNPMFNFAVKPMPQPCPPPTIHMLKVFESLTKSSFYDETIVIFTSDHGDLLGAHGYLHQKWYCAYEEFVHVPLIIHNKQLFAQEAHFDKLTSHLDIIPTMLGLADADLEGIQNRLRQKFNEVHPFVGRDLSPCLFGFECERADEPIYFMTDDDVTRGPHQVNPLGIPYASVIQPNHIETVIACITRNDSSNCGNFPVILTTINFGAIPRAATGLTASSLKQNQSQMNTKCIIYLRTLSKLAISPISLLRQRKRNLFRSL
jgi:arylsulfatase A-like enzyme